MKYLSLLLLLTILFACKKQVSDPVNSTGMILNNQVQENRVSYFWEYITPYPKSVNDSIKFYHIADASSPIVNGEVTSATGIEIVDHYCYVTYHIAGAVYGGAIEVFDISTPANPLLVSQLIFEDADFNECTVADGKLYAVGGRDVYSSDFTQYDTKGGVILEVTLNQNLLTNNVRWGALPSYSGNSVNVVGDYLYVASGSTGGGIFTLNRSDLALVQADYFDNAKFCDVKNNQPGEKMLALQGYPSAKIHEYAATPDNISGKLSHDILSQVVPANGKAVLHIDQDKAYVCTGANGLMGFNLSDLNNPFLEFNSPLEGNANGVDTDNDFIYVANGLEGLIIINKDDYTIHTIFEYNGSANYVQANGKYVFIANGKGGLKIIRRVDPLPEVPQCENREELTPGKINGAFVVNMSQKLAYKGNNTFNRDLTNWGSFYYCGDLRVMGKVILNNGSVTEMNGSLHVKDLFINPGSILRVSGNLIVDGDLHLKGKLEFIGTGNTVTINGNVLKTNGYSVSGNYTSNKPL